MEFFRSMDWTNIISAAIFGTLGFMAKSLIDYLKERSLKKTQSHIDIEKMRWEQRREFSFNTLECLFQIKKISSDIFVVLDHAHNGDEESIRYCIEGTSILTAKMITLLDKINQFYAHLTLIEDDIGKLTSLRYQFCQYLSDHGLKRQYQAQIISALNSNPHIYLEDLMKLDSISKNARRQLKQWPIQLVGSLKIAFRNMRSSQKQYPTLAQRKIKFHSLKYDTSELSLDDDSLRFVSIVSEILEFTSDQRLSGLYKQQY